MPPIGTPPPTSTMAAEPVNATSSRLKKLSGQLPGLINNQVTQQQNSNLVNLQNAVQQTVGAGGQATTGQVQQLGGQVAAQQGQAVVEGAKAGSQQNTQIMQAGAQQLQGNRKLELARKSLELEKTSNQLQGELDEMNATLKAEIFDKQMEFQKDELGRSIMNERQLADFKIMTAKSDEELRDFEQQVNYYSKLRMNMLQAAHKKIVQSMEQAHKLSEFDKDSALRIRLARAKADLEKKMAEEAARQKNRGSLFQAGGTIIGAAAGSFIAPVGGTAAGAAAGAAIGGAVGSAAAGLTS